MRMRAAVYHEFGGEIAIESLPHPVAPEDGVVVQVKATGVCRSDWHGWKGHDSDIKDHGLPFVPGHELSGVVSEVGAKVQRFKPGDRVAIPFILSCGACRECDRHRGTICATQQQPGFTLLGSFAEYVALPRADHNMCHIPEGVSFTAAAALGCRFTTAYRAVLQQGRLADGETVAVFGCGGLGLSVIMIACTKKVRVIAIDKNPDALRLAESLGAHHTVDASATQVREAVLALTDGTGADLTVDAAGFPATCEDAVWTVRAGGRMVQVGLPVGGRDPIVPMGRVAAREIELIGSHGLDARDLPDILELVRLGQLHPERLISRQVTLEEGAQAIQDMDTASPLGITMVTTL